MINAAIHQELFMRFKRNVDEQTRSNLLGLVDSVMGMGYDIFVVGGSTRDLLLGKQPKDFDFCTNAPIHFLKEKLAVKGHTSVIETGIEHGTITVHFKNNKDDFEITQFRKDVSTDGRRATVAFTDSLDEDLNRRDLTINAIAWNPLQGQLISGKEFDGVDDLLRGRLTFIGNAVDRIEEDHLRALRFLRFAVQLTEHGFAFNCNVWDKKVVPTFDQSVLSFERIVAELEKILANAHKLNKRDQNFVVHCLADLNLFERFNLGMSRTEFEDLFANMLNHGSFWPLISAVLDENTVVGATEMLKLPADDIKLVNKFKNTNWKTPFGQFEFFFTEIMMLDILTVVDSFDLTHQKANDIKSLFLASNEEEFFKLLEDVRDRPFAIRHLAINGNDLMQLGKKGKEIGDTLGSLLTLVKSHHTMNDKETLINLINQ